MKYGKGLLRTPDAKKAHRLGAELHPDIAAAKAAGPKGSGQLTPAKRTDQGQSGCCHSHSAVAVVWCALTAAGLSPQFLGSPRMLASCTYADVRAATTPAGAALPVLQDNGADLQDDANAMAKWGLAPIQAPTSDGRYSDVENDPPDNSFPEPDPAQLVVGSQHLVSGEYTIPVDAQAPLLVAAAIDAGIPVWLGTFVDTAFEDLAADAVAQPANQADPNGGGHALYISGYRTAADGSLEFRVENSWGDGWCDGGACWASTAWLLACWELFPCPVKVTS